MNRINKKIIIAALFLVIISVGAFAQSTSGTIVLQGTVPQILGITVTSDAIASNLDLSADVTDQKVGSVVEFSNKRAGYTVSVESQNAFTSGTADAFFKSADATNSDTLTYSISYGGVPVALTGGSAVVSDQTVKTAATGSPNDVAITYSGSTGFLYEDSYSDTLTFTIAAK